MLCNTWELYIIIKHEVHNHCTGLNITAVVEKYKTKNDVHTL